MSSIFSRSVNKYGVYVGVDDSIDEFFYSE